MSAPLVSICLPNLNTRRFLPERLETILGQTHRNWELIVSDNCSTDGSWPLFESLAQKDRRVAIAQAPREGMYANWNRCIRRAQGEFVYLATSDDTMAPDCLEKLVAALEAHPACDVAHCRLRPIDDDGHDDVGKAEWWSRDSMFARSSGPLLHRLHIRQAPFDGLLHLLGGSVYVSITQLLIRRSLFHRIGLFESTWGSVGDFNWDMRAGLVANTVHVPDTWGGWRIHADQATARVSKGSVEHAGKVDEMIGHAFAACDRYLHPLLRERLRSRWLRQAGELRAFRREAAGRGRGVVVRRVLAGSVPVWEHVKARLQGRPFHEWVRQCLDEVGYVPIVVPASVGQAYLTPVAMSGAAIQ